MKGNKERMRWLAGVLAYLVQVFLVAMPRLGLNIAFPGQTESASSGMTNAWVPGQGWIKV
jgi:hypothetical protein